MTWTEGVTHIFGGIEIHSGYLGVILFSIFVICIILFLLFICAVGGLIGDTIKEINEREYEIKNRRNNKIYNYYDKRRRNK